jgi:thiol-disulfide isomerase/thioredoxin
VKTGAIVVVVIVAAAATGVLLQRTLQEKPAVVATSTGSGANSDAPADGAATPRTETAAKPLVIPATLPHFELADRDGKKRSLGEWQGQPLMVNFWATWCGPCRREIPLLNQLRVDHKARKLEIIGIAVDFRDDVLNYAKENPISYPLLIGEEDGLEAVHAMGVASATFPFTVFADSQHRIFRLQIGELHREDVELILDRMLQVEAGKLGVPDARQQVEAGLKEFATKRATAKATTKG